MTNETALPTSEVVPRDTVQLFVAIGEMKSMMQIHKETLSEVRTQLTNLATDHTTEIASLKSGRAANERWVKIMGSILLFCIAFFGWYGDKIITQFESLHQTVENIKTDIALLEGSRNDNSSTHKNAKH